MTDSSSNNILSSAEQELVTKYKTLARAVAANDIEGCEALFKAYTEVHAKTLSPEEVHALGMRWLLNNKTVKDVEVAKFLGRIGFDFEQVIIVDPENERVGEPIPFRLMDSPEEHDLLMTLIENNLVDLNIGDGMGDSLLVTALDRQLYDLATRLKDAGLSVDSTNMAGQTALHVFAAKVNYGAIDWLCRNGADPTIEDIQDARASEMVPEEMPGWDVECLYELLEQYVVDFRAGNGFTSTPEFNEQVEKEKPDHDPSRTLQDDLDEFDDVINTQLGGLPSPSGP